MGSSAGAPSFLARSDFFTLILLLTISFSEILHQLTIRSHLWHFISRSSRFCVLVLSLPQKAGSETSISQATSQETPRLSLFTSRYQNCMYQTYSSQPLESNHHPLWWYFSEDEGVQYSDVLPFTFCLYFSLHPTEGIIIPSSCRKHRCVLNTLSHSLDTLALSLNTLQCNIFRSLHFPDYLNKTFRSLCLQGKAEGGALRESRSFCLLPVIVLEEVFSPGLIMSFLPFH